MSSATAAASFRGRAACAASSGRGEGGARPRLLLARASRGRGRHVARQDARARRGRAPSRRRAALVLRAAAASGDAGAADDAPAARKTRTVKIFSVNDVYELHNLSALKCFVEDHVEKGEPHLLTLNGDFLSPSLLSSLDLGAAAVRVMNAVGVTHACLGNHEFDHSVATLGLRLSELECEVVNTNVFACPVGAERGSASAAAAATRGPTGVPFPAVSGVGGGGGDGDGDDVAPSAAATLGAGAFLDELPRASIAEINGVKIGLLGVCTTSTPLSSAKKPVGVVFADAIPMARHHARELLPRVDAIVALTHQTLPEDARLAEDVPEIGLILGGHEHTPFAGRMGHGANAASVGAGVAANDADGGGGACVNDEAGTLCVKAGMDAECVVVVEVELPEPDGDGRDAVGADRGGECTAANAAGGVADAAYAARKHHDDFGHGGLWSDAIDDADGASNNVVAAPTPSGAGTGAKRTPLPRSGEEDAEVVDHRARPGAEVGKEVAVVRPGSGVRISARMFSLRGYRTDPAVDAEIYERSEILRGMNQHTLSLHEHGETLGLTPLSSRDSRGGQCSLGTLFATILRDECGADVCLYNSGGIRGNARYGSDALTYGDLVAEVPFENNIITLTMKGREVAAAIGFSEAERERRSREGGSWGGYLQYDAGVDAKVVPATREAHPFATGVDRATVPVKIKGAPFDPDATYRVVTWAGLLDGADDIPVFRDIGARISNAVHHAECDPEDEACIAEAEAARSGGGGGGGGPAAAVINSSDGVPFKILVMRHLARLRWREILETYRVEPGSGSSLISNDDAFFAAVDRDGDGLITASDVRVVLEARTASASAEREAEAMVRVFDGDGDGAVSRWDVAELTSHWSGATETDGETTSRALPSAC